MSRRSMIWWGGAFPWLAHRTLSMSRLLADARAHGPKAVANRVRDRLDGLVAAGADIICCTCSTIGDVAEGTDAVVPVFRVDRPMARLYEVADTIRGLASRVDVSVLAQASMTGAETRLTGHGVPVLSSSRLAVEHFATRAERASAIAAIRSFKGWSRGASLP